MDLLWFIYSHDFLGEGSLGEGRFIFPVRVS